MLLATFRGMLSRQYEAENVLQSAGASVAVRGVLFGNFHPLTSRYMLQLILLYEQGFVQFRIDH